MSRMAKQRAGVVVGVWGASSGVGRRAGWQALAALAMGCQSLARGYRGVVITGNHWQWQVGGGVGVLLDWQSVAAAAHPLPVVVHPLSIESRGCQRGCWTTQHRKQGWNRESKGHCLYSQPHSMGSYPGWSSTSSTGNHWQSSSTPCQALAIAVNGVAPPAPPCPGIGNRWQSMHPLPPSGVAGRAGAAPTQQHPPPLAPHPLVPPYFPVGERGTEFAISGLGIYPYGPVQSSYSVLPV